MDATVQVRAGGLVEVIAAPVNDSERDAAPRINAAFQEGALVGTGGVEVHLPPGTYWCKSTVVIPTGCTLVGSGAGTVVKAADGLNADVIANDSAATAVQIRDLKVDGNRANQTTAGNGINLDSSDDAVIANVVVSNCYDDGILLTDCARPILTGVAALSNGVHGVHLAGSSYASGSVVARDNGQMTAGSGLALDDDSGGNGSTDATIMLSATDTRADVSKTQQYGVIEIAGSHCDRNTILGSCNGNATGTASFVGSLSALVGGIALTTQTLDGGSATSTVTAVVDGGSATSASTNTFDGGTSLG